MSDAGDDHIRRLEREARHDPAAAVALEAARQRREDATDSENGDREPTAVDPHAARDAELDREEGAVVDDTLDSERRVPLRLAAIAARPCKNPVWVRSIWRAGLPSVDLVSGPWAKSNVPGLVENGGMPAYMLHHWYGLSVLPTITPDNRDAVLEVWERGTFHFDFQQSEILRMPAKLVMPNPVLLPFAGASLDAIRAALGTDEVLARRLLQRSLFAMPIRDVTVSGLPIELPPMTPFRAQMHTYPSTDGLGADVELLFVMFGITMRGVQ